MPKYEASVRAFKYVTVEADSEEEAKEKAKEAVKADSEYGWQVEDAEAERTLL